MTTKDYKALAESISTQPGVYKFVDAEGIILYVGKAKNLKNRVASYFGDRKDMPRKTRVLVKNADHLEFLLVETEADALLLENSLIKKYQPRYNVNLKDAKSYSYLCIKNERFPRVFITRKVIKDGSYYFGPYTSKARLKVILELVKQLFPLRTCKLHLSQDNIGKQKFKVCLEYHIKNCLGPCENLESEGEYNERIGQIKNIMKGNFGAVIQHFKIEMKKYAEALDFEKAQHLKEKLSAFEDYQSKSTVVSIKIKDVDVFSIIRNEKEAYVNYLKVVNGAIINTHTLELIKNLDEEEDKLLAYAIPIIREQFNSIAPEIIVPIELSTEDPNLKITIPKRGEKLKLLELSQKNVKYYDLQKRKEEASKVKRQTSAERILKTLQKDLNMQYLPLHIECFDNSNIQGSHPVSSCVVFKMPSLPKRIIDIIILRRLLAQMTLPQWRKLYFEDIDGF